MFRLYITGDIGFEFWMDIPGFEGLYQASTYGRIRSLDFVDSLNRFHKGKVLHQSLSNNGYLIVTLKKKGKTTRTVHRLIALTFLPSKHKPCIDHKDTDRLNNRVENLSFSTYSENNTNPITRKKMSDSRKKKTYVYTKDGEYVGVYPSFREASSGTGCLLYAVWKVLTGQWKHTHNLVFSYEPIRT